MIDVHALRQAAEQAREQAATAQANELAERADSHPAGGAYDDVLRRRAEARMSRQPGEEREDR